MAASDARPVPRKNVAYRVTFPILDADGDLVTGATALDSEVSIDGGTFADCASEATEIATASGMYFLDLTAGEMNGDTIAVIVKTTSSGAKTTPIVFYPEEVGDFRVDTAALATAIWQDATAGDFTVASSIGKSLFTGNNVPGAAGGMFIAGSNAATTIAGLTTGALSCTTITASGAVAFQSTFAVTTSTALAALSCTTLTASGAVAFQSTFAVTTSTSLAALSCTTLTATGAVAFNTTFTVTTSTSLGALSCTTLTASGAVAFQSTFTVTTSTSLAALSATTFTTSGTVTFNAFTVTNVFTVSGATTLTGAVTAANASNNIVGIDVAKISGDTAAADNLEAEYDGTGFKSYVRRGTAQAGGASTITLDAGANATDSYYNNLVIGIISGTGAGQGRIILSYVGATKVATVSSAWVTNPASDSVFVLLPFGSIPGASAPTAADVADAVWDEARAGHVAAGSFGEYVLADAIRISGDATAADNLEAEYDGTGFANYLRRATAQAGSTSTTIVLDTSAANNDDLFNGNWVVIYSGTGAGQTRAITRYVGTTKVATVDPAWDTTPDNTSVFQIMPASSVVLMLPDTPVLHTGTAQAGAASTLTLEAGTASALDDYYKGAQLKIFAGTGAAQIRTITGYVGATKVATVDRVWITTPNNTSRYSVMSVTGPSLDTSLRVGLQDGSIVAATIAVGAIQATTFVASAINAAALATDAANEIRDAVWADVMTELSAAPSVTGTMKAAVSWLFELAKNRRTTTGGVETLVKDDNSTTLSTATVSDDGTTFVRAKWS